MPDTKPQDAPTDEFDLDAWIDEASLPETSVTIVGDGKLRAEFQRLEAELKRAQAAYAGDGRMNNPAEQIAAEMAAVSSKSAASERTFTFRALTDAESKAVRASVPKNESGEPDGDDVAVAWLAASSVSPKMTEAQVRRIRTRIGEGQFLELTAAAINISNDRHPDIPFSLAASVALTNKGS